MSEQVTTLFKGRVGGLQRHQPEDVIENTTSKTVSNFTVPYFILFPRLCAIAIGMCTRSASCLLLSLVTNTSVTYAVPFSLLFQQGRFKAAEYLISYLVTVPHLHSYAISKHDA